MRNFARRFKVIERRNIAGGVDSGLSGKVCSANYSKLFAPGSVVLHLNLWFLHTNLGRGGMMLCWSGMGRHLFWSGADVTNNGATKVKSMLYKHSLAGGTTPETNEIVTLICGCHNFFPLSSVQILYIPACCLLCVL